MECQPLLVPHLAASTDRTRRTVPLKPQNFAALRSNCLASQTLFTDPEFPAADSSLFFKGRSSTPPPKPVQWKRPKEISTNPQLFVEGASRFDIKQGDLGDCWLLAAMANLTLYESLFNQVVPQDQGFKDNYAGIFHFRFWQYGRWVDVVIDDQLPTCDGRLVYLRSSNKDEFWSALLEKAYAKLHGSYEAIDGGLPIEAMQDFTGGVSETYKLADNPPNLFQTMKKAYRSGSMMGCLIHGNGDEIEAVTSDGLAKDHAYSITGVKVFDMEEGGTRRQVQLIRLRNPWGNDTEWTGAWSDKSRHWNSIAIGQRKEIELISKSDGEFWMSFDDFMRHFSILEICNSTARSFAEGSEERTQWVLEGEWVRGVTAGGCPNNSDSFWMNPQYRITLLTPDDGDEDGECSIIVGLMQKNRRSLRRLGLTNLGIGFVIYSLEDSDKPGPLDTDFFRYNKPQYTSSFTNAREVSGRVQLKPGVYYIIPSTYAPHQEAEFILRVLTESENRMQENDRNVDIGEMDPDIVDSREPEVGHEDLELFSLIAGDDMEVDWKTLNTVLNRMTRNEANHQGFSKDVCRSMIAMMDVDRSGKLGLEEYKTLLLAIRRWKAVFKKYDTDDSGSLDVMELRQAMASAGYRLNNHLLTTIVHRYSTQEGSITLDDFIMCSVRLKTMIGVFQKKDLALTGSATFTLEEWLDTTLYS